MNFLKELFACDPLPETRAQDAAAVTQPQPRIMFENVRPVLAAQHRPQQLMQWVIGLLSVFSVVGAGIIASQLPPWESGEQGAVIASGFVCGFAWYAFGILIDCVRHIRYHTAIMAEAAMADARKDAVES